MDGDGKGYELRDYKSHREFSFFREFTGNHVAVHE